MSYKSVEGFFGGIAPKITSSYAYSNDPYNSSALPCRLWYSTTTKSKIHVFYLLLESILTLSVLNNFVYILFPVLNVYIHAFAA